MIPPVKLQTGSCSDLFICRLGLASGPICYSRSPVSKADCAHRIRNSMRYVLLMETLVLFC